MTQDATGVSKPAAADNPSQRYHSAGYRNYVLALLTVVYAFNFIDRQLLAILQEPIKHELGLSDAQLGLLTGFAFALFYVTAGIPIARWADRSVRRSIVALAIGTWSFMTAISGFAQNYIQLLLARVGVGIGEAGGSPPAHSMISDIFPPQQRATVLAIYSTGINIGILFGFLLGGWLNEFFGWRVAFLVVGLPGIAIALLVRFTVAEPPRGFSENVKEEVASPPLKETLALLWSRPAFKHMSYGAALSAFVGYGGANWMAPFFIRSHGMNTGELGTWLALTAGIAGAAGTFFAGYISDRLGRQDQRWYLWTVSLATLLAAPFLAATLALDNTYAALLCYVVPGFVGAFFVGPCLAMTHGMVGLRMRALGSAIFFFIVNLVGLGLGPWVVGTTSDFLSDSYGTESLRYAMLFLLPIVAIWACLHYLRAASYLRQDLARAPK